MCTHGGDAPSTSSASQMWWQLRMNTAVWCGAYLRSQTISAFWQRVIFFCHAASSEPKHVVHTHWSAQGFPGQVSYWPVDKVTLHQLIIAPTSQEAQQCAFACVPARFWHMSFVLIVPELLEDLVVLDEGLNQSVVVGREKAGQTVGLGGPVQQAPLGILLRDWSRSWFLVGLCEVEDVRLMVQHHPGAARVVPIHIVNTVTFKKINK